MSGGGATKPQRKRDGPREQQDALRALHNDTREAMLTRIRENPGITALALKEQCGVGWGTLYHHLHVLERTDRAMSVLQGRRRVMFPKTDDADEEREREIAVRSILHGKTAHAVYEVVRLQPGVNIESIAARTGASLRAIYYHVKRLVDAGLVESPSRTRYSHLYVHGLAASAHPPGLSTGTNLSRKPARGAARIERERRRREILRLVTEEPGLTSAEIRFRLGMAPDMFRDDLAALRAGKHIQSHRLGRHRLIVPQGTSLPTRSLEGSRVRLNPQFVAIAQQLVAEPARHDVWTLSRTLWKSPRVVYYHLRRMRVLGLISTTRSGGYRQLRAKPELVTLIAEARTP